MFSISTIAIILTLLILYSIIFSSINVLPANYAENKLIEEKSKISSSKNVTPNLIPDTCKYGVYSKNGKIISGNLSSKEATKAWNAVKNSERGSDFLHHYLKIPRENEVCIVQYSISSQYASPTLRKFLPNPDLFLIFFFCFGFILEVFLLAYSLGKKLTKNIELLQEVSRKIQNQNLDFSIKPSGIFEIDNVLSSMDEMKEALKTSMKKQWDLQQERRNQISSLAHDVKTPLTIVIGNAELLSETNQSDEQREYTNYIINSAQDMQQYIKTLIEISKADIGYTLRKEEFYIKKFIDEIYSHINALTSIKKIKVDFKINNVSKVFKVDFKLLQRAIMNVVSNAVDYSKENDTIIFSVDETPKYIRFTICDNGKGFSKEALLNAKQQFYMENLGRDSRSHFGMGLYISDSIVRKHNGKMELTNGSVAKGAQINIYIPI